MPSGDPTTTQYYILYVPVLFALGLALWATYVKVYSVPMARYTELLEREKAATARAERAEAASRALELLHEQLVSERKRGDELRDLLRTATMGAAQAATVAERAQRLAERSGTGGAV